LRALWYDRSPQSRIQESLTTRDEEGAAALRPYKEMCGKRRRFSQVQLMG